MTEGEGQEHVHDNSCALQTLRDPQELTLLEATDWVSIKSTLHPQENTKGAVITNHSQCLVAQKAQHHPVSAGFPDHPVESRNSRGRAGGRKLFSPSPKKYSSSWL